MLGSAEAECAVAGGRTSPVANVGAGAGTRSRDITPFLEANPRNPAIARPFRPRLRRHMLRHARIGHPAAVE